MAATMTMTDATAERRDAFLERMLECVTGAFSVFTIHVGNKLGFYRVLAEAGPQTAGELALRTSTQVRYVREWLEQQTVAGILEVENPNDPAAARRFYLPAGHDEALTDTESLNYLAPVATVVVGATRPLDAVLEAFRNGGGVPYEDYGADLREGIAALNRPMYLQELGQKWIPAMPDVEERLRSQTGARVADFGCGAGWSSIGLAQCYPNVQVDGFDLDAASIEMARANAAKCGVADRVHFQVRDAADEELAGRYDLVMACECVHDMADPVGALGTMRRLVNGAGTVLVVDERVSETFTPTGNDVEPINYGFSVLHCLPVGMDGGHSVGTGTCMRPDTLRGYARQAGFRDIEILPVENLFFRLYRLHQ